MFKKLLVQVMSAHDSGTLNDTLDVLDRALQAKKISIDECELLCNLLFRAEATWGLLDIITNQHDTLPEDVRVAGRLLRCQLHKKMGLEHEQV